MERAVFLDIDKTANFGGIASISIIFQIRKARIILQYLFSYAYFVDEIFKIAICEKIK